jgi:hypothetical protein
MMARCQPEEGHTLIISQATLVEAVASFCRKAREQNLSQCISKTERDRNIALFRQDTRQQYSLVRVNSTIYSQEGDLCRFHRLRAYDAVQLACALEVRSTLAALGVSLTFVSADNDLLNIAHLEGLSIENPNLSSQP